MGETTDGVTTGTEAGDVEIPTRVLVLGMAHHDGTILASELYPVAEACGQSSDQVRSCLRRLVGESLFTREGEGRDATFHATEAGMRALGASLERTRLAYAQDAAGKSWDRKWRMVAFAIPEARRSARDAFRDRLLELGGAAIQNGLYVSPHRWEKDALAEADRLDVREHVTLAVTDELDVGGVSDPRELAAKLWPIDELAARYESFCAIYEGIPEDLEEMRRQHRRLTESEFLPGALIIGIKFRECFDVDPLLPPELLPRPWPGRQARELLARSRRLGILLREEHNKPQLFAPLDDVLGTF
ncbi:MAG: PaaX family transcriptional regulator C-terminal domain-containing protein [Acidimicrobiales bacterium]